MVYLKHKVAKQQIFTISQLSIKCRQAALLRTATFSSCCICNTVVLMHCTRRKTNVNCKVYLQLKCRQHKQ